MESPSENGMEEDFDFQNLRELRLQQLRVRLLFEVNRTSYDFLVRKRGCRGRSFLNRGVEPMNWLMKGSF